MYHYKGSLKVGQVNRFVIEIDHDDLPATIDDETLSIRVKNTTSALMRPAYLAGPYILYMSIREQSYRHDSPLGEGDFPPHFDANVKTNCSRWQSFPITPPRDSKLQQRTFEIDVESQIIFSPSAETHFEVTIGRNKHEVRQAAKAGKAINSSIPGFRVEVMDTEAIWSMPPIPRDYPGHHISRDQLLGNGPDLQKDADGDAYDHLVVLTHGIHSNLTTDMLYIKERIEAMGRSNGDRVICKGFAGNVCNTERGVKWLAENVGEWVLRETGWKCNNGHAMRMTNPYKKISFIAHSLGGLVQIYALGYLHDKTGGRIFRPHKSGLEPINFVTLATPWLGISAENPAYVKFALDFGLIGKTGQDLGLTLKPLGEYKVYTNEGMDGPQLVRSRAPLLSLLSMKGSPSHIAIRLFARRTIYANIENDGIVPLRTSSLYFLDWEGFSAKKARAQRKVDSEKQQSKDDSDEDRDPQDVYGMDGAQDSPSGSRKERLHRPDKKEPPGSHGVDSADYSSEDDPDDIPASPNLVNHKAMDGRPDSSASQSGVKQKRPVSFPGLARQRSGDSVNTITPEGSPLSRNRNDTDGDEHGADSAPPSPTPNSHLSPRSTFRSVAHALNFTSMIRRVSQPRVSSLTGIPNSSEGPADQDNVPKSPIEDREQTQTSSEEGPPGRASGPSDDMENASHSNGGLLSLLKPNQSHRKPSKAFTRSQTIPRDNTEGHEQVPPEEPSRTGFFRSLESVLNPPMPALDYLIDPASRESTETVLVHDKYYYPRDIPPLKELPPRTTAAKKVVPQTHSARKEEEKERVRLEKVKLEERIARGWHEDMAWRKVLVKLRPDAHNNIIVRRAFANSYGWKVIDHLTEHHFGKSAAENLEKHKEHSNVPEHTEPGTNKYVNGERHREDIDEWDRASLLVGSSLSDTEDQDRNHMENDQHAA